MSILLKLQKEGTDQDSIHLEIQARDMLIQFIPASDAEEDLLAAAEKRDQFNFFLSYFLSPYIGSEINYDADMDVDNLDLKGFAILLQFNNPINYDLVHSMFRANHFPPKAFSNFFTEADREEIITTCHDYFSKDAEVKNFITETTSEEIPPSFPEIQRKPIVLYLEELRQIIERNMTGKVNGLDDALEKMRIVARMLKFIASEENQRIEEIQKNYQQLKDNYKQLHLELQNNREHEAKIFTESINEKQILDSIEKLIQEINDQLEKKILFEHYFPESHLHNEEEMFNSYQNEDETMASLTKRMGLLRDNIKEAQRVLFYVPLSEHLKIRREMKHANSSLAGIYDDFLFNRGKFSLFSDKELKEQVKELEAQHKTTLGMMNP